VAGYDPQTKEFRAYDAGTQTWGPARTAPWEAKKCDKCDSCQDPFCDKSVCKCDNPKFGDTIETDVAQNFGIDAGWRKRAQGPESYTLNGEHVTRESAEQSLTADNQLTDDSGKLRLTVIGADADRNAVIADLAKAPAFAAYRDQFLIQPYPPDHWAVKTEGFVTSGKPTIYVQAPGGKVLHRQDDYEGGAPALVEAIRKTQPNYDPKADQDARKDSPTGTDLAPWGIGLGLGTLVLLALKRKAAPK
jgi:hypothetical protein